MSRRTSTRPPLGEIWGTGSCAQCGASLVLGEPVEHVVRAGRRVPICLDCASRPAAPAGIDIGAGVARTVEDLRRAA